MKLSELTKKYREDHKISQRQFASQCLLSSGYISLIEKEYNPQTGKKMVPTITILNKLAKGMGMTLDELLSLCDDMPVTLSSETKIIDSDETKKAPTLVIEDECTIEFINLYSQLTEAEQNIVLASIKGILSAR